MRKASNIQYFGLVRLGLRFACWEYISKLQRKNPINKHHESISKNHAKQNFAHASEP